MRINVAHGYFVGRRSKSPTICLMFETLRMPRKSCEEYLTLRIVVISIARTLAIGVFQKELRQGM